MRERRSRCQGEPRGCTGAGATSPADAPLLKRRPSLGALAVLVVVVVGAAFWWLSAPIPGGGAPVATVNSAPPPPNTVQDAPADTPDFGTVLLNEDFRDNRNRWPIASDHMLAVLLWGEGRYAMSSSTVYGYTASIPIQIEQGSDFHKIRCRVTRRMGCSQLLLWSDLGEAGRGELLRLRHYGPGHRCSREKTRADSSLTPSTRHRSTNT